MYVDLFAGPGVCVLKESGKRIPGSVLIAAHAPKPFRKIIACEMKPKLAQACEARLKSVVGSRGHVIVGDCNKRASEIAGLIPRKSLTLAFIDPTGLGAHFETIRTISSGKPVDLLVLFPDRIDIVRNVEHVYRKQSDSKLDRVLGPDSNWRQRFSELPNHLADNVCKFFVETYKNQLERHLGYKAIGHHPLPTAQGRLYQLIYASKHELGLKFWEEVTKKDRGGQKRLL